ncbi:MAG: three-Cys-motif partner protein TcmP [bacterium]
MPKISKKDKIWEILPHTEAKHAILKKYLAAWLPIMTRFNGNIIYIDGFAGPGEYSGGKDGSPIIAIKAILEQKEIIHSNIRMVFIEDNEDRCGFLEQKTNH